MVADVDDDIGNHSQASAAFQSGSTLGIWTVARHAGVQHADGYRGGAGATLLQIF